jgi:Flp pilus assembly protein TadD
MKALYQRGIANMRLKNFDEATIDLKNAIKLNPQDKNLRKEFDNLKAEKKKHNSN